MSKLFSTLETTSVIIFRHLAVLEFELYLYIFLPTLMNSLQVSRLLFQPFRFSCSREMCRVIRVPTSVHVYNKFSSRCLGGA